MTPSGERISVMLEAFAGEVEGATSIREILDHFGERAIGAMLVVFAAPLVMPMPPGVSAVLGLPLIIFTAQLTIGASRAWLPRGLGARAIRRRDVAGVVRRILPLVRAIERPLRPRMTWLLVPLSLRLVGLVAFLLAVIVFLPIPFGNMFPSFAIAVLGLGLVERDGLAVLMGWLVAVASLAFLALISRTLLAAAVAFIGEVARSLHG